MESSNNNTNLLYVKKFNINEGKLIMNLMFLLFKRWVHDFVTKYVFTY